MQFLRSFVVCGSVLVSCALSDAATRTVGPGDDVPAAVQAMQSGDTLVFQDGTYRTGELQPPSGRPGAPTTLTAAPGARPVLVPAEGQQETFLDLQGDTHDVTVDGLTLDGQHTVAFPVYGAPDVRNNTFQNGEIRNGRQSGMLVGGAQWTITNNDIHNNGTNCCATHSDDHGIYFSASDSRIAGNRFAGNACHNLQIYGGSDPSNNVVEDNYFTGSKCGVALTSGHNQTFRNNTVENDGTEDGSVLLRAGNITASGNRITGTKVVAENVTSGDVGGASAQGAGTPSVSPPRAPSQPSTRRSQRVATSVSPGHALRVLPHP